MKNIRQHIVLTFQLVIAVAFTISCGSTKQANIEHGMGYNFQAGHPEFRASSFGFVDEDDGPILQIRAEVIKSSLSFKKDGDSLSARIGVDFQIQDVDNPENVIANKHIEKTITVKEKQSLSSRETINLEYNFQVKPSRYTIRTYVEDLNTNKALTHTDEAYIPETESGAYTLSNIQLYGKQNGQNGWQKIDTYDVKGKVDSLRFVFQLISGKSDKKMTLNSRLLRFESDTSYPRPMHYSNYSPSSIEYKGIDYDRETEIQSTQRILTDYRSIFIEYKFENQERGNYRFEVTAKKENGEDEEDEQYKGRAFGVKSKNYPAIQTSHEMAKPLVYLMDEDDYKELMKISDPDSLKKEIDRFWLKEVGHAGRARDVIELYYNRVEQANKQFSNFKEGWKTDFGMVYILFGPPWYTEDRLKEINWFYSYNRQDPEYSYQFHQPKLKNKFYPFYHYLLERRNFYYTVQYTQRQLWLSGQILIQRL